MNNFRSNDGTHTEIISQDIDEYRIKPGLESELFNILDGALDVGISVLDEDLNYLYVNRFAAEVMHLKADEFHIGHSLSDVHKIMVKHDVIDPAVLNQNKLTEHEMQELINAGYKNYRDLTPLKDGSIHRLTRKLTKEGYTVSINHDVTRLLQKEQLLQKALELGNSGYWTYDFQTKKVQLSESMKTLLTKEEISAIYANGILSIIHQDDHALFKRSIKAMASGENAVDFVHRNKLGTKWFRITGNGERGPDNKLQKLRAFFSDVTKSKLQALELEKAKDRAIAANIAKSEFLANMSHEIRTPMNGVLGMAELLAESDIDDRQRDYIKVITRSSNALLTIINDILDFSKIEAGAFELDPTPFNFRDSVNDVAALLAPTAHEKSLELVIDYPLKQASQFIADGGRLRQVLTNLVGNAIKFTQTGHVAVEVNTEPISDTHNTLTVSVKDTGIGINKSDQDSIFDKFTQADSSTTRLYGGTGLGLSITKKIVELMDGDIKVKSKLGQGSVFTLKMPIALDPAASKTDIDPQSLPHKRVLIVDDVDVNRSILKQRLQSWDMQCLAVKDGVEALVAINKANANKTPFDLILLDHLMPGMDGGDLATLLQSNPDTANCNIIMLSSASSGFSKQDLEKMGISSFLVKPVNVNHLQSEMVLALSHAPQNNAPEHETAPSIPSHTSAQSQQPQDGIHTILVAEDFALNQDVVRLMLVDTDYTPVFANNGKEAFTLYKEDPTRFSAVLMDISMPVMDGYEAARKIHAHKTQAGLPDIPIIALTGHALKHDREKCLDAHMHDYLTKPVKQDGLLDVLDLWVLEKGRNLKIA